LGIGEGGLLQDCVHQPYCPLGRAFFHPRVESFVSTLGSASFLHQFLPSSTPLEGVEELGGLIGNIRGIRKNKIDSYLNGDGRLRTGGNGL